MPAPKAKPKTKLGKALAASLSIRSRRNAQCPPAPAGAKAQEGQPFPPEILAALNKKGHAIATFVLAQQGEGQAVAASSMPVCPPGVKGPPMPEAEDVGPAAPKKPRQRDWSSSSDNEPAFSLKTQAFNLARGRALAGQGQAQLGAPELRPVIATGTAGGSGALEMPDSLCEELMAEQPQCPIVTHLESRPATPTPSEAGQGKRRCPKPKLSLLSSEGDHISSFRQGWAKAPRVELGEASLSADGFYLQLNGQHFTCAHCHISIKKDTAGAWCGRQLATRYSFSFRCSSCMSASNWMIRVASSCCDPETYQTFAGQRWSDRLDFWKASRGLSNQALQALLTAKWGLKVEEVEKLDNGGFTLWKDELGVQKHPELEDRPEQIARILKGPSKWDEARGCDLYPVTIYATETHEARELRRSQEQSGEQSERIRAAPKAKALAGPRSPRSPNHQSFLSVRANKQLEKAERDLAKVRAKEEAAKAKEEVATAKVQAKAAAQERLAKAKKERDARKQALAVSKAEAAAKEMTESQKARIEDAIAEAEHLLTSTQRNFDLMQQRLPEDTTPEADRFATSMRSILGFLWLTVYHKHWVDLGAVRDSLAAHKDSKRWVAPVVTKDLKQASLLGTQLKEGLYHFLEAKRVDKEQFAPAPAPAVVEVPADQPGATA